MIMIFEGGTPHDVGTSHQSMTKRGDLTLLYDAEPELEIAPVRPHRAAQLLVREEGHRYSGRETARSLLMLTIKFAQHETRWDLDVLSVGAR